MSVKSLLDTDMTTLAHAAQAGLDWWFGELTEMVPRQLRRRAEGQVLTFDGEVLSPSSYVSGRVTVMLSPALCLVRRLQRPLMSTRDFALQMELDRDRIMPLPEARMLVGAHFVSRDVERRRMVVEIAGLARDKAERLAAELAVRDVAPSGILLRREGENVIDFLPAMRSAGLIGGHGPKARPWWILVSTLIFLNLALVVWRDEVSVLRLEERIESQQPALVVAKRLRQQLARTDALMHSSVSRRRENDVLAVIGGLSEALPPGTVVQQLTWRGATLRLSGYAANRAGLRNALRKLPFLTDVESSIPDGATPLPIGEPFDVTARVMRVR